MLMDDDRISTGQAMALVINAILGVSLTILPRDVAKTAGPDCWILVILGGVFAFIAALIIAAVITRFNGKTFTEYTSFVLGRPAGFLAGALYAFYFVLVCAVVLRNFAEVMKNFVLETTPREFVIITLLLLSFYLIRHGLEPMVRFMVINFPIWFITAIVALILTLNKVDFSELLPSFRTPPDKILFGSVSAAISMAGFEVLMVAGQGLKTTRHVYKIAAVSIGIVTAFYIYLVVIVVSMLGVDETRRLLWPTFAVLRSITVPGGVLERIEAPIIIVWVIMVFTTLSAYYFSATITFANLFKAKEFKIFAPLLFPWIYFLSMMPQNVLELENWLKFAGNLAVVFGLIIPFILLIAGSVKARWGKSK
ncbi:GerAB/ArcD/ProY family transporter [Thermosediminibacter litoriperuensis]|uniref:Spore germination protein n=1 Tax=Thermosediminibacter litoriperuensis TaxID=291989 RepID=A0A5S5AG46_9FIRM|nr:endospore germination permease [Thermosediminibacter litoriperuensis]TYP49233.1 spore germination protein [Thermosediminibacter litoriperuensis]